MNGRQRYLESLMFGNPDKVFLTTSFGPRQSTLDRWHKEGLPEDDSHIRIHGLEPEFLMADPTMVPVEMGPAYRHKDGSTKAKLKTFELPTTGRHTLVVRGLESTTGTFKLKFKLEHPRKFKATGLIEFSFATSLTRSSSRSSGTCTTWDWSTTMVSAKAAVRRPCSRGAPSRLCSLLSRSSAKSAWQS